MKKFFLVVGNFLSILALLIWLVPVTAHADFYQNRLIDDSVFDNSNSMNATQIDDFLNGFPNSCISTNSGFDSRLPTGYSPSGGFTYGDFVSAGQVISTSAQVYGINPKVLITTLQKEQSLVEGGAGYCNNGDEHKYAAAAGYGCPDSGSVYSYTGVSLYRRNGSERTSTGSTCVNSSSKAGFSQQVIRAAWLLKFGQQRSLGNIGWSVVFGSWDNSDDPQSCYGGPMTQGYRQVCPSGPTNYYDGYTSIDGTAVHMDTGGTAALYWYTPHFHGNQNFVSLYEGWFGSTRFMISSPPTVETSGNGKINLFARGQDSKLYEKWFNGSWIDYWNNLGGDQVSSTLGAVSWGNGHMDLFETRSDGGIRHKWYLPDGNGWRGWENLGKPAGVSKLSPPTVESSRNGQISLFARGSDGRLWERWYDNGQWNSSGWNNLGGDQVSSKPTAVSFGNGHMDLFETTSDGSIRHRWYVPDGKGWRYWDYLGKPNGTSLNSPAAVESSGYGKINLFVRGSDGRLWEKWFADGHWNSGWNNLGGSKVSSAPTAVSFGNGHMDLFETTSDGTVRHRWYVPDGNGWRDWEYL